MKKTNQKGFTLIELLVVIAIIGLLSTLAVVALNNARQKSRDAKRVADAKQIQTALEMYFNECSAYPSQLAGPLLTTSQAVSGECRSGGSNPTTFGKYMAQIPTAPTPADGPCNATTDNPYRYISCDATGAACDTTTIANIASYVMEFCLGGTTGQLSEGSNYIVPSGTVTDAGNSGLNP